MDMVEKIARSLSRRGRSCVEVDDLVQAGRLAMITAEARYRSEEGASFDTFAGYRVKGAMLDEFRRYTWAPRSVLRAKHEAAKGDRTLSHTEQLDVGNIHPVSLDSCPEVEETVASGWPGPDDVYEREESESRLSELVDGLSPRERSAIELTYFDGMTLEEAGECMGVTESRACQIRTQAEARLREALRS